MEDEEEVKVIEIVSDHHQPTMTDEQRQRLPEEHKSQQRDVALDTRKTQVRQFAQAVQPLQQRPPPNHQILDSYEFYHDEQLSLQKRAAAFDPSKMEAWRPILERLRNDERFFPRQFLPLIELNCLSFEGGAFPEHLHLFGMDSCKIRDFNAAFMEYGVQKKQYHRFYRRITTSGMEEESKESSGQSATVPLPEAFLSLRCVSELDFISFAKYWSDF